MWKWQTTQWPPWLFQWKPYFLYVVTCWKLTDIWKGPVYWLVAPALASRLLYISKSFERVNWTHSYNTRHSNKGNYVLPKIRTETGKKPIVYWGPKIWQEVPPDIKSIPLLLFKKYTNHFIRHYINRWCLQSMDLEFSDVTEQHLLQTYLACGSYPLFLGLVHYLECTSVFE